MGYGPGSHPEEEQAYQEAVAEQNSALMLHNEELGNQNDRLREEVEQLTAKIQVLLKALRALSKPRLEVECFCPHGMVVRSHTIQCMKAQAALRMME